MGRKKVTAIRKWPSGKGTKGEPKLSAGAGAGGNPNGFTRSANSRKTSLELVYTAQSCELGKAGVPETDPVKELLSKEVEPEGRRVAVLRDHTLEYPELFLEVFIAGDRFEEAAFAPMFSRARCQRAPSILEADLVVFTGGHDVDPRLYGAEPSKKSRYNEERDTEDINLYLMCLEHGIPMFGVCRGAQFIHVMNGGKLFQDVDNHNGSHSMYDVRAKRVIDKISSVHHQMCIPNPQGGMELLGTAPGRSLHRMIDDKNLEEGKHTDVEAFFYRDTCCFGVQGHPEYSGYNFYTKWCLDMIQDLVIMNPDIGWENEKGSSPNRRINPDLLKKRNALARLKPLLVLTDKEEKK